ncbi:YpjP family protein [Neobacillus sp. PS3-40]|uniref:YpjP family protein n=1 Tax=Neobacillus sp. PS3-40 TaxID=3070679 RepID=UPI0027DFD98F|nr:YpjP family protein [Neobacillus sp. PS3-40]WML45017.1 YpjP family protein [Neobacillus sp. PS3-40]
MNNWLRKTFVVLVSILTFGIITPSQLINNVNAEKPSDRDVFETNMLINSIDQSTIFLDDSKFSKDTLIEELTKQAEMQTYQKFGVKIKPAIEDEFREIILPNIEKAIAKTTAQFPNEDLQNLAISEQPGGGYSEKIFHVKNIHTNEDILLFHVRRDNPPQAGYWFNFHYHTIYDGFQSHHDLGSIYWDKNTPPKWMS